MLGHADAARGDHALSSVPYEVLRPASAAKGSEASGEVEERPDLLAHGRLLPCHRTDQFVLVKHAPDRCEKTRQLARANATS